ncbi:methyltransferase [uncultured Mailhella sp.]|uniref:tRNA1(Val) (adenine(37)-N6)-methyltransferase n=1 Tax=uncultured Mailhella sp. TaxID=1981031 RepID=UPI00260DB55C|nr:methyltransferase [uncultured Mailhella sp.]
MRLDTDRRSARERFPAGLEQPEGSFRFSRDALLLAEFAAEHLPVRGAAADLGMGCGVAALALLLSRPEWSAVGVEVQTELALCAARNIRLLGLEERAAVVEGDVSDILALRHTREALAGMCGRAGKELPLFDAVLCNPPWRLAGTGRTPPSDLRRRALFGSPRTLPDFFHAADLLLVQRGVLAAVCGAERLADALSALPPRLHPELVRLVFTRKDAPAAFVLLLARKGGRAALRVEKLEAFEA